MKRIFALLLALMMLVMLTACGGDKTEKEDAPPKTETAEPAPEAPPSGINEDGMGEDPSYGEGIGEVIALSEEEKSYVSAVATLTWLEMTPTEKDDCIALLARWLEDDSGYIVEDFDDMVVTLDRQMEQYFKNGVNESVLAAVCDIYGVAMPADAPARPSGTQDDGIGKTPSGIQDDGIGETPSGIQDDGMGEDPSYGEGIGEVIAISEEDKAYVTAQNTNSWLELSKEQKDDLVVLIGRWLEDFSGYIVEDYDDMVTVLDRQMEQYFKNSVNEGVLATVCDIYGTAMPTR